MSKPLETIIAVSLGIMASSLFMIALSIIHIAFT